MPHSKLENSAASAQRPGVLKTEIQTRTRTTRDGILNLSLKVGLENADVDVLIEVKPRVAAEGVDSKGWPKGYFDRVVGFMPELSRPPQGGFEDRLALE